MADGNDGLMYYLVQQGRKFTELRSATLPDLAVLPGERRKVIYFRSADLAEHKRMAGVLLEHLGATREGAAL